MTSETNGLSTDYSLCNQQFKLLFILALALKTFELNMHFSRVMASGMKTVIHIDKDSFHVN